MFMDLSRATGCLGNAVKSRCAANSVHAVLSLTPKVKSSIIASSNAQSQTRSLQEQVKHPVWLLKT